MIARHTLLAGLAAALLLSVTGRAGASVISWTDWTGATSGQVDGSLSIGATAVDVTYSGPFSFAQTGPSTYWWGNFGTGAPPPSTAYTSSALVDNAPPDSDIIGLNTGGTKTITFSQAVADPLIALVSWNGNVVDFGVPIEILSFGTGHWGSGTPVLNGTGTGFTGTGEVHGVIRLPGSHTSITFTDTSENWHGFTLGVVGLASAIPEPGTLALLVSAALLAGAARTRRCAAAHRTTA